MWAALFPGQGSQHSGMGKFLYDNFPVAKELFEEASDTLSVDFKKLCFDGPESDLALTHNTQPCLLLVSTATSRVLNSLAPFNPVASAGHSIGEYAALVATGTIPFTDALVAVRKRGEYMQSAVPVGKGAMAAVMGVTPEQMKEICQWAERESGLGPIEPANYNAPGQIVASGQKEAVDWLAKNYSPDALSGEKPRRVKFIPLKVSAPFHCSMMKPAEEKMRKTLVDIPFADAAYPVVQNFTAEAVKEGNILRENLIRQISAPVRWVECVERLVQMGSQRVVELGCGKVLSGLAKKIDSTHLQTFNINSIEELKTLEQALQA